MATIPETFVAFPDRFAVIVFAEKLPVASLATIALFVFTEVAVVAAFVTFPAVDIVANFVSSIAAVGEIFELSIAPAATKGKSAVPVKSPANFNFPFVVVVASSVDALAITNSVVAICVVFVANAAVGAVGIPVRLGEAKGAFKSNAVCVAVEIGLFKSVVLST